MYETELQVRFRDIDAMGHVNNAVYATYLEQARADFYADVLGESLESVETVIANLSIEFRAPIELGDPVRIELSIPEVGRSSVPMEYEVYAGDDLAATAETTQVAWDRESGESRPVPEAWRRRIEEHEGL